MKSKGKGLGGDIAKADQRDIACCETQCSAVKAQEKMERDSWELRFF